MELLLKIPLSIPDEVAGSFLEAQQHVSDLFFGDLLTAKQFALLETFAMTAPGSPEQLSALRESLKQDIKLIETARAVKSIELLSEQVADENV